MTSRARRLMLALGVAAVVAVVVGGVMVPDTAAAPRKPKPNRTFVIQVNHYFGIWADWATWEGTGALDGSGAAILLGDSDLQLLNKRGTIDLQLHADNTFTIAGGTRKFSELSGGGSFSKDHYYYWPPGVPEYPPEDPPNGGLIAEDVYVLQGILDGR